MSEPGILLSFYASDEDAADVLRALRRKRFRRAAMIHRSSEGRLRINDISPRHGALWGVILGLVLAIAVALLSVIFGPRKMSDVTTPYLLLTLGGVLGGLIAGGLAGWLYVRLFELGVDDDLIERCGRWLIAGETVLVTQASPEQMGRAIAFLRGISETQPSIFALRPGQIGEMDDDAVHGEPMTPAQLQQHARRLAAAHRVEADTSRSEPLLRRLTVCGQTIESVRRDLTEASRLEQAISTSAEWLLDNAYIIQTQINDVRLNLPRRFYHELPVLSAGEHQGWPRVYAIALELIRHTDGMLSRQNITELLSAYQESGPLTMGELWALPLMLRIALIDSLRQLAEQVEQRLREREYADFWANRLLSATRRDPNQLFPILAELANEQSDPSAYFAFQLTGHLYDEESALVPVRSWLERKLGNALADINNAEQARQAADQVSIGNAITSLRQLSLMDWREVFEARSFTEQALRRDPAGVYSKMAFATRDEYRHAVEEIARSAKVDEAAVTDAVLELAHAGGDPAPGDDLRRRHVGFYLVGDGRAELVERLGCRDTLRRRVLQRVYRRHTGLYLGAIAATCAVLVGIAVTIDAAIGAARWKLWVVGLAALWPAGELAVQIVNYLITRLLPPRTLPKLDFEKSGIPDEFRTLVVVPMMLVNRETIREEIQKLEIRYLANPDGNLVYALFSDFTDADEPHRDEDAELLRRAVEGIEDLHSRYGSARFFLLHRGREWCESEGRYIGWERKRGKLEELNLLLNGLPSRVQGRQLVHAGNPDLLADVRFVITLDADTQLPRDAARKLVETMAHPLNQPRVAADGTTVVDGYTIIQPRVTTSLPTATATPFSRMFTEAVGIDPYTQAVSDVYQDLAGEGSYIGKGIYDPRAFHTVLADRFPERTLLSHDLIEGAHVRCGLATDVQLLDDFPPDYLTYASRQHRWIRGDWQIAPWLGRKVPVPDGSADNPLSTLNQWKVFDNLRRSLVPVASVAFLVACWLLSPMLGAVASALIGGLLLFPPMAGVLTAATTRKGWQHLNRRQLANDVLRALANAALMPHQAGLALDAITRVLWRRLVSGKRLLEWTTAQMAGWQARGRVRAFLTHMGGVSIFAGGLAGVILWRQPAAIAGAAPFLLLWGLSPLAGWWLTRRPRERSHRSLLSRSDVQMLRQVARKTWRYFDDFVGPETYWLPPDNYQVSHRDELAPRTSPTNIGLWLLSALGANDFGYITADDAIGRVSETFRTLAELEQHEGHLLNWYDLQTLAPLEPRYVSTVDSGNFIGSLWTLEQGAGELIAQPVIDRRALDGLADSLAILEQALARTGSEDPHHTRAIESLGRCVASPPKRLGEIIKRIRNAVDPADMLASSLRHGAGPEDEAAYWAEQIRGQVAAWMTVIDRYLPWASMLVDEPEETLLLLGHGAVQAQRRALGEAPSLRQLAAGRVPAAHALQIARERTGELPKAVTEWLDRFDDALAKAQWLAGETLAAAEELIRRSRALSDGINMRFLYDPQRRLFSIGLNLSEGRLDGSYYDLLASEARLGSFVAVARGDVPTQHWLSMGRPFGSVGRRRVLLSWSGTMFEYLMPMLVQRNYANSLLSQATGEAVALQRDYARDRNVPWGISESAYSDLDANRTYQYKAFGVPGLGLKRGLDEELVVAPYATMLALMVDPPAAVRNLKRLDRMQMTGGYGYFEAIDFSRRQRGGQRGVIVHAYMAHHQAMGFLAIGNLLHNNCMQRRFHADPRVKATEPLLYERIPVAPPLYHVPTQERVPSRVMPAEVAPSASRFDTAHTLTPKTQLLCNGRYALMVTNAGGGFSRWDEFEINRWRADTTTDERGSFCYIRDIDSDRFWSNTFQPTRAPAEFYQAVFHVDRAEFRRSDLGVETATEIIVSPEDDAEIRRITLVNRSGRKRRLDVTTCTELAMAPHNADRQHPAFNKLFVQTEFVQSRGALLASRRGRDPDDPPLWVSHQVTFEQPSRPPHEFETDRDAFVGRGRDLSDPAAMHGGLGGGAGQVLDPMLALRREVVLEPGGRASFSIVTGATGSREAAAALIDKYSDPQAINRALDLAWTHSQLELRHLRIQPDEARRFQQLASHMLFPNDQLRPPSERLRANRLPQSGLWPHGISGDLPIAVVSIGEARDIAVVRQMLEAHTYWRRHGLKADLVVLNEESSSYDQPLHEQLLRLVQAHSLYTGVDQPGGVFLRTVDQIPEPDLALILAAARVSLVAARGPLAQQLATPIEPAELPPLLSTRRVAEEPSAPLPFMELPYFNGLGGFTEDGREYAIYLGPEARTPAPWINVLANPSFGCLLSESGSGFTWQGNSQSNRLTCWSNDAVSDPPSEAVYIRDEETGVFWTPTPLPVRELDAYRCRHGAGYTVFEHNSHAVDQELTTFVPIDDDGGEPVRVQMLKLTNESHRPRRLSVTFYNDWTCGEHRETTQLHVITSLDSQTRAMLARNHYHADYGDHVAFAAVSPAADSYTADRTVFLGRNGSMARPAAMTRAALSERAGAGLDPCAALQVKVDLQPGQSATVVALLGQAPSRDEARRIVRKFSDPHRAADELARTSQWWDTLLGAVQVATPELSADFLLNRWLLYQDLACRVWGRSGFYQSGGAFGFRDQLQDVMALLHAAPSIARQHILRAAARQFRAGDVLHWWHPPAGKGIRSRCSDDLLWLPLAAARYVQVTGDAAILDEQVPFIAGRALEDDEHEIYIEPETTDDTASLYDHCCLAIERGLTAGPHDLPLIGTCDWNDGLNRVGHEGKGESVWLAWFLIEVMNRFAESADAVGRDEDARGLRVRAERLARTVEDQAWDGQWYRRGYFDDGTPLGSARNDEAMIDSLPQSWATITAAARPDRARQALASAIEHLVLPADSLVLLFTPPFDKGELNPGYIKGYPPGVRENGGQYTHAALWLAMAVARGGDGDRAVELLNMMNPIEDTRDMEAVQRYVVEPYAIAADVYRLPGRVGRGGWTWYTGSAGWTYRVWLEEILGFKPAGETLRIDPSIPAAWEGFTIRYRRGEAIYEITVENPDRVNRGVVWVEMDGRRLEGRSIPLETRSIRHRVTVRMGRPGGGNGRRAGMDADAADAKPSADESSDHRRPGVDPSPATGRRPGNGDE